MKKKNKSKNRIEAVVEFTLIYPYYRSAETIYDLTSLWGLRIVKRTANSQTMIIGIPFKKFKQMFNHNPRVGPFDVPAKLSKVITEMCVKKIDIHD